MTNSLLILFGFVLGVVGMAGSFFVGKILTECQLRKEYNGKLKEDVKLMRETIVEAAKEEEKK